MQAWIISICSITILTFIVKTSLPDGRSKKTLIFAFSLISLVVIVGPIKNFLSQASGDIIFDNEFEIEVDTAYTEHVNACREKYYLTLAKSHLSSKKIALNAAQFFFDDKTSGTPLNKIIIFYDDLEFFGTGANINLITTVKKALSELFAISEEQIYVESF